VDAKKKKRLFKQDGKKPEKKPSKNERMRAKAENTVQRSLVVSSKT